MSWGQLKSFQLICSEGIHEHNPGQEDFEQLHDLAPCKDHEELVVKRVSGRQQNIGEGEQT